MSQSIHEKRINSSEGEQIQLSRKPLSSVLWWFVFLVATYVMSLCFECFRVFTITPTVVNAAWLLLSLFMMAQILLVMVYDSYIQERIKGNVFNTLPVFEWMIRKRFLLSSIHLVPAQKDL